jgi:DNA-directed RNA polymerase subunit beta'
VLDTTVGRAILNERLTRDGLPFVNGTLKKKGLQSLVSFCHLKLGHEPTVALLDDLKAMGFLYATKSECLSASTIWSRPRARPELSKRPVRKLINSRSNTKKRP